MLCNRVIFARTTGILKTTKTFQTATNKGVECWISGNYTWREVRPRKEIFSPPPIPCRHPPGTSVTPPPSPGSHPPPLSWENPPPLGNFNKKRSPPRLELPLHLPQGEKIKITRNVHQVQKAWEGENHSNLGSKPRLPQKRVEMLEFPGQRLGTF